MNKIKEGFLYGLGAVFAYGLLTFIAGLIEVGAMLFMGVGNVF